MVNIAYENSTRSEEECLKHNMTNPNTIKFYINATWYGDSKYVEDFLSETGMTTYQFDRFFSKSDPASFGYAIAQENKINAVNF